MRSVSDPTGTLSPLKQALLAIEELQARLKAAERRAREPIAIIGLACRFPGGADTPAAFWRLLAEGVDAVTEVPPDRWNADEFFSPDPTQSGRTCARHGGFLRDIESFDPAFFGISPREAASMDPQHRLLLEVANDALTASGQLRDRLAGSPMGVFVGITTVEHGERQLGAEGLTTLNAYHVTGNALNAAAGRLSYVFGLHGPCLAVDTACSSSLVAVHLACASLRAGECATALAGGVNLMLSPFGSIALSQGRVLSPTGRARAFDAAADGMVRGEGCGVLVLKRLSDAQRDGDRILAVVRASSVNQDGPSSGLTVPNGPAQEALLRRVLAEAGVEPRAVGYIEAHGTGTALGDPLEVGALGAVFGADRSANDPLWIGSVKTNLGHLESAAGVAGLIKAVLALQHGAIPPHLHFQTPSPHIPWDRLPLRVPVALTPWPRVATPRLAGVSAFGFSGTNAHVLLEEGPIPAPAADASRGLVAPPVASKRQRFPLPRLVVPGVSAALPAGGHPLLGRAVALAGSVERRFESTVAAGAPAFLGEHRVFGRVVLPAAAWLEIALAAAREIFGSIRAMVCDLSIQQPLVLGETGRVLQTVVTPAGEGGAEVKIFSRALEGDDAWTMHVTARVTARSDTGGRTDLVAARTRCTRRVDVAAMYAGYATRGLDYRPAFRAVTALQAGDGEAVADIRLVAGLRAAGFALHPVLLDACFQAAGAALGENPADAVYLPLAVGSWTLEGAPADAVTCHVRARVDTGNVVVDFGIFDPTGNEIARLKQLVLQRATPETLRRALRTTDDDALYEIAWMAPGELGAVAPADATGAWLVAGSDSMAAAFARRLRDCGAKVSALSHGADAMTMRAMLATQPAWRGVVHWVPDVDDAAERACADVLELARAVAEHGNTGAVCLVTRRGVAVNETDLRPGVAAVWGFGRALQAEHPELNCRLVDVDDGATDIEALVAECARPDRENQIAWRSGRRLVARLQRLAAPEADAAPVRPDATYLITGGLGALGLLTSGWLVRRGARHLALVGRHPPLAAAKAQIAEWEQAGVRVAVRATDVADRGAMERMLAEVAAAMPPLRGLVHAAGLIDDGAVSQQTAERLALVWGAKAAGAWHLHEFTRAVPLDFFVLFSSTAAVLGTPGQSTYAAASAFVDGLAHARRAAGLPALSVNWGPWSAGMAAEIGDRYVARGISPIAPERGFRSLEQLLGAGIAQATVLRVEWDQFTRSFDGAPVPPLLTGLAAKRAPADVALTAAEFQARLAVVLPDARGALLEDFVRGEAARVLRVAPERLSATQPLNSFGLDSLMAIELRNRFRTVAGVDVSVGAVLDGASIGRLAAELQQYLEEPEAAAHPATAAGSGKNDTLTPERAADTLARLDQLSDDEVEALLDANGAGRGGR